MLSTPEKSGLNLTVPSARISMRQSLLRTVTSQRLLPSSSCCEMLRWLASLQTANMPDENIREGGAAGAGVADGLGGVGGVGAVFACAVAFGISPAIAACGASDGRVLAEGFAMAAAAGLAACMFGRAAAAGTGAMAGLAWSSGWLSFT